nr:probable peptidylglycine alpha-hydroxylating monooxygenase 1 isoform X2 [Crassostrea virginica]
MKCLIYVSLFLTVQGAPQRRDISKLPLKMPQVSPKVKDTYLCHAVETSQQNPTYITGFVPEANKDIAHHILIYGCTTPGSQDSVWNCGEMAHTTDDYSSAGVCGTGSQIVYAWAMDAPSLTLPKDVGFKVGGDSDIKYLVLQVHYKNVDSFLPPKNGKDSSGVTLLTTSTPMPRAAGVYLLGTGGSIPPKSVEYMETACEINEDIVMHPFAFRTHAHTHGEVTAGYRIRDGKWTEIGRMSPHKPQMFYNVTSPDIEVRRGDILAARCTMKNDESRTIQIGATQNDEMCNFYIMYFVDGERTANSHNCFSAGPPYYYWDNSPMVHKMNLKDAPQTASLIPDKNVYLKISSPAHPGMSQQDVTLDENVQDRRLVRLLDYLNNAYGDPDYYPPL